MLSTSLNIGATIDSFGVINLLTDGYCRQLSSRNVAESYANRVGAELGYAAVLATAL